MFWYAAAPSAFLVAACSASQLAVAENTPNACIVVFVVLFYIAAKVKVSKSVCDFLGTMFDLGSTVAELLFAAPEFLEHVLGCHPFVHPFRPHPHSTHSIPGAVGCTPRYAFR